MKVKRAFVVIGLTWVSAACTSDPEPVPTVTVDAAVTLAPDSGQECPALTVGNCGLAYDCVNFEAATAKWLAQCDAHTINVRREGCGYDILQHTYGEGDTLLAFYHPESGELEGWWHHGDTGGAQCAGDVPDGCAQFVAGPNVCDPADTGAPSSDVTDTGVGASEAGAPDSGADGGLFGTLPDGGRVACCPISDEPDCCMDYGGADRYGCGTWCDGMPLPSEQWTKSVDPYGCPIWVEPTRSNDCCGCPPTNDTGTADGGTATGSSSDSLDASSPASSPDAAWPAADASR